MKKIISILSLCLLLFGAIPVYAAEANVQDQNEGIEYSGNNLATNVTINPSTGNPVQYSKTEDFIVFTEVIPKSQEQLSDATSPDQQIIVDLRVVIYNVYGSKIGEIIFRNCSYQQYYNSSGGYYYYYWTDVHDDYDIIYYAPNFYIRQVSHTVDNTNVEGDQSRVKYDVSWQYNGESGVDSTYFYCPVNS